MRCRVRKLPVLQTMTVFLITRFTNLDRQNLTLTSVYLYKLGQHASRCREKSKYYILLNHFTNPEKFLVRTNKSLALYAIRL